MTSKQPRWAGGRKVAEVRRQVWQAYPHTCHLCGQTISSFEQFEPDHVVPRAALDPRDWWLISNLRPAHGRKSAEKCNQRRGKRSVQQARRQMRVVDDLDGFFQ